MARRHSTLTLLAGGALALAALAAACGGSGGTATPPAGATAAGGQSFTVVPSNSTPAADFTPPTLPTLSPADKTAITRGPNASYVPYTDKDGRYTVDVPEGWALQARPNAVDLTLAGDGVTVPTSAYVNIYCEPNFTAQQLIQQDQQISQNASSSPMKLDKQYSTTVAGVPATAVPWSASFGALNLDHLYLYFEGGGCGWRLGLTTFPGTSIDDMEQVLTHMAQTFKLTQS